MLSQASEMVTELKLNFLSTMAVKFDLVASLFSKSYLLRCRLHENPKTAFSNISTLKSVFGKLFPLTVSTRCVWTKRPIRKGNVVRVDTVWTGTKLKERKSYRLPNTVFLIQKLINNSQSLDQSNG